MWIFMKDGFLSIVENTENKDELLVRARAKGDIERYWPEAKVKMTPDHDYLYRAFIPRKTVADVLYKEIAGIDYPNYKNSISDKKRRSAFYAMVWHYMARMQEVLRFGRIKE